MDYKEWFKAHNMIDCRNGFIPEEEARYQAFKARLQAEIAIQAPSLRTLGILVDKP